MRKNVHIVCQGKGGVGKTFVCWLLAQFLLERNGSDQVLCADTDPVNKSFAAFHGLKVHTIDLFGEDHRNVEPGDFEKLFEFIQLSDKTDLVIDTGASNFVPFQTFLSMDRADQMLADTNCNLILHVPICGGENRQECVSRLEILINDVPNARFVVWINNFPTIVYPKRKSVDSKAPEKFEETETFQMYTNKIFGIVDLPLLPQDSTGRTLKILTNAHLTFDEFIKLGDGSGAIPIVNDVAITYLQKFRAKQIKEALFKGTGLEALFSKLDDLKDLGAVDVISHDEKIVSQRPVYVQGLGDVSTEAESEKRGRDASEADFENALADEDFSGDESGETEV